MIAGFVLAGGRSRRLGRDKALLPIQGQPLALRTATTLLRAGCQPVALVGDQPALHTLHLPVIADAAPPGAERHPLWGVAAALAASPSPLALLCPCDLPDLTAEIIAQILAAPRPCVAAGQPLLGLLPRTWAPLAARLAAEGAPVRRFVETLPTLSVDESSLRNINRPEDIPEEGP